MHGTLVCMHRHFFNPTCAFFLAQHGNFVLLCMRSHCVHFSLALPHLGPKIWDNIDPSLKHLGPKIWNNIYPSLNDSSPLTFKKQYRDVHISAYDDR